MAKPRHIIGFEAENVMRLRAVSLKPTGGLNIVGGRNAQGKSSLLKSIEIALRGERSIPAQPVRVGEDHARVELDLGDITVTRTIEVDGKSKLKVTSKDLGAISSPQTLLNKMFGAVSFDPLAFLKLDAKAQLALLASMVGLDLTSFNDQRKAKYDARTDVNRSVAQLEGQLKGMPLHDDAPAEEISVAEISDALKAAQTAKASADAARRDADFAERLYDQTRGHVVRTEEEIADLQDKLDDARHRLESWKRDEEQQQQQAQKAVAAAQEAARGVPDVEPMHQRLAQAEGANRKLRENEARTKVAAELDGARASADQLTSDIDLIDMAKRESVAAATFPVPALSVGEDGVTLNGLPFEQASGAEQLRASVAIGLHGNPELRVLLIREGSLLDEDGLALLAEIAEEHGAQIFLERVSRGEEVSVLIEDGSVVERPAKKSKAEAAE